ncbi:YALI0D05687p KAB8284608.1 6-O-methylguanine DNA methyltransferase, partial [Lipomyces arxii]|uniref:YALI0D05687p KAB8284608.1 6-O-methylguanine DNA methyltransferase n=1 Tax=Lipomyces arxii TaxID=56418 RepID=UPI0034CF00A4
TDQAEAFYIAVYETVQRIPRGRVTSYGHIALLIDAPQNSRQVGSALKYLRDVPELSDSYQIDNEAENWWTEFNSRTVPWWRVISADGKIAVRARGAMDAQGERLQAEGIEVRDDGNRRPRIINMREYGWF